MNFDLKLIDARFRRLYTHKLYEPEFATYTKEEVDELHDFAPDIIPNISGFMPVKSENSGSTKYRMKNVEETTVSVTRWQIGNGEIQAIGISTIRNTFTWNDWNNDCQIYPIIAFENAIPETGEDLLGTCFGIAETVYFRGMGNDSPWVKNEAETWRIGQMLAHKLEHSTIVFERYDNPLFAFGCEYNYTDLWTPDKDYDRLNEFAMVVLDDNGNPHVMLEQDRRYPPGSIELL